MQLAAGKINYDDLTKRVFRQCPLLAQSGRFTVSSILAGALRNGDSPWTNSASLLPISIRLTRISSPAKFLTRSWVPCSPMLSVFHIRELVQFQLLRDPHRLDNRRRP